MVKVNSVQAKPEGISCTYKVKAKPESSCTTELAGESEDSCCEWCKPSRETASAPCEPNPEAAVAHVWAITPHRTLTSLGIHLLRPKPAARTAPVDLPNRFHVREPGTALEDAAAVGKKQPDLFLVFQRN